MLVMDASGACKPTTKPLKVAAPVSVEHAIGDVTLRLTGTPVVSLADLNAGAPLLNVPLPLPFGRGLWLAPVLWSALRSDAATSLTSKRLDDLLLRLRDTTTRGPTNLPAAAVLLAPATVEEAEECENDDAALSIEDDNDSASSEYLSDAEEGEEEEEEEEGEEEEEEDLPEPV